MPYIAELAIRSTMLPADEADGLWVFRNALMNDIDDNDLCELFFTALEVMSRSTPPLHNQIICGDSSQCMVATGVGRT
jgi:hypothetical protein